MSLKKKILFRISLALSATALAIILIVILNVRYTMIDSAKQKAYLVSEITRDALTAHMVNGMMDKRDLFLSNIARMQGVQSLRIVRGETVVRQFGRTRTNENPEDAIDLRVLKTGHAEDDITENLFDAKLRTTIPYIANTVGSPNCLECHQAKNGDVLGAITMEFDLADIKTAGASTVGKIILISLFSLAIVLVILNRFLNPYLELFTQLSDNIKAADEGDFSKRISTPLRDEAGKAAGWFNDFMQKLEDAFHEISRNIGTFVVKTEYNRDPLSETKNVVKELSEIYKFKRTIENDSTKQDIYRRIGTLLQHRFEITNFTIFEIDSDKNMRHIVMQNGQQNVCSSGVSNNVELCRAKRTGKDVVSDDFYNVCACFAGGEEHAYLCIPVFVGGKVILVINIVANTTHEQERIKILLPKIQNYLNESTSVIESKKLTELLRESSLRDAMTGLYNRRFLEEYLSKTMPQAVRNSTKVGILMIDMDHFKMVNDTYGHDIGDTILKKLAQVITDNVRQGDLAVRYGGEEFLVILNDVADIEAVMSVAQKLREKVSEMSVRAGNETIKKTISVGVSLFPDDTDIVWKCIKFADVALYNAKDSGRNKVVRFEPSMWTEEGSEY